MEKTFIAIKPDGVKRGLIGRIINRFEDKGYKIIGLKMINPTLEIASQHYQEHKDKPFYKDLINYLTSGPIIAMVIEGENVINGSRQIMGCTCPDDADVGTIRADFARVTRFNVIHGSDSVESAKREIDIYFNENELCTNYKNIIEMFEYK